MCMIVCLLWLYYKLLAGYNYYTNDRDNKNNDKSSCLGAKKDCIKPCEACTTKRTINGPQLAAELVVFPSHQSRLLSLLPPGTHSGENGTPCLGPYPTGYACLSVPNILETFSQTISGPL